MQRINEWIEKEENPQELVADLSKNFAKAIVRVLELLNEYLVFDIEKCEVKEAKAFETRVGKLQDLSLRVMNSLKSNTYTLDLTPVENGCRVILSHVWSPGHTLTQEIYASLQEKVHVCLCKILKHLIRVLGPSALHSKILKIIRLFTNNCKAPKHLNALLVEFLKSIGNSASDLVFDYLSTNKIPEIVLGNLQVLSCSESVTLGLCKKNKQKKIGNGHQRRHHKVVMKKSENKKLKEATDETSGSIEIEMVYSFLKLMREFLLASPVVNVDLDMMFSLVVPKIRTELREILLEVMFYYAVSQRKFIKKLSVLLHELLTDVDLRGRCRYFLFILDNLNR